MPHAIGSRTGDQCHEVRRPGSGRRAHRLTWWVTDGEFDFEWRESGGPHVEPPTRRGFGSRMIERALAGYFSGTAGMDYQQTGLVFSLRGPLDALTAD